MEKIITKKWVFAMKMVLDQVWSFSRHNRQRKIMLPRISPKTSLNHSIGSYYLPIENVWVLVSESPLQLILPTARVLFSKVPS